MSVVSNRGGRSTTVAAVMGLITLSLIKVWISTSNNPDNL
ncbi:YnaM/YnfT family protein [Enterobacter chengduensis]